ncbi:SDR family NAD(P)-dependent oxidoreductase [Algiphilus sp.]|uniref:SDR family NAD(P)-dependent oxidoreductase n=1 Tax=Algiphilus sp. TaxID=1872431 RepID=UPI0025BD92E5|nr:SDR family NAD(P)-dependent oxidoreductase [Algiphilus sp.]MCK5771759.1 SDR family NAD(P)-dependent oxidoreductase [Algiphilus sp.]
MAKLDLADAVVVITGSSGELGRGLAWALSERGARLALMDLDEDAVTTQARALGNPERARGWSVDVRSMSALQNAMDAAAAHFGRIDVVIANAGVATLEPLATQTPRSFERVIDINVNGVFRTFKAAHPHVTASRGHLLAIASMASFFHSPMQGAYAASKAAVWALCDSIRVELRHTGVTVGSIHPTFFKTPLADGLTENAAGRTLYNGNRGLFRKTTLGAVVEATVPAIERRAETAIIPRQHRIIASWPMLMRRLTDRILFRDSAIAKAMSELEH